MTAKWFVPGRLEVLGKHTDYAGGRSLLAAIERGITITLVTREDDLVTVVDAGRLVTFETHLGPDLTSAHAGPGQYAFTSLRRFARNFPHARRGGVITIDSNLPEASGMSSSSAMMIGIFLALAEANALASDPAAAAIYRSPETLATYLACVENGQSFEQYEGDQGVGTSGGSEDHTAILCCTEGALAQYAFCPVRHERTIPFDAAWTFAVAVSGVRAHKTGAALELYNAAAASVRHILRIWREGTGRDDRVLADALASEPDATERLRQLLASSGYAASIPRLEQFIEESHVLVPAAADELSRGNLPAFGALVARSQALAEQALGNQVPETVELAASARRVGAHAASAFGAGFGGSVWALVDTAGREAFLQRWRAEYRVAFPGSNSGATFFLTRPGPAAHRIE